MRSPFDFEHADPWSSDIVDVESLNAQVSDLIASRIDAVRVAAGHGPRELCSTSLLALGPAGAGKTHLFARLRRKCGRRAAFVMMRPEIGLSPTPRHVLAAAVDSLQQPVFGADGERQLDVVVAWMLGALDPDHSSWPHVLLEHHRHSSDAEREHLVARAMDYLEGLYPEISANFLEQLLLVPFRSSVDRRAAVTWLSGREPSEAQLARLGRSSPLADVDVMPAMKTLAIVAAFGAPIALVFDQLENLVDVDAEDARVVSHGNLMSELFDNVRGLTMVQLALDAEWERRIRPRLSASQRSRVEASIEILALPTATQREELIRAWLSRLPESERARSYPSPFTAEQIAAWRSAPAMTPRMLMIACREALGSPGRAPPDTETAASEMRDRLDELWQAHVRQARHELGRTAEAGRGLDATRLLSALLAATRIQPGIKATASSIKGLATLDIFQTRPDCGGAFGLAHPSPSRGARKQSRLGFHAGRSRRPGRSAETIRTLSRTANRRGSASARGSASPLSETCGARRGSRCHR